MVAISFRVTQKSKNISVTMDWLIDKTVHPEAEISLARMTLAPGALSERHKHSNCSETVHLVSGQIKLLCDNEKSVLQAGDTLLIKRGQAHQMRNITHQPAVMILAYSAGTRNYQAC